ncbi:MAG TPA: sulfotransferase [Thermoanaerobaculia bacterium]|nr:sulfotransferase [Thermoanaerobaculia bacterium]
MAVLPMTDVLYLMGHGYSGSTLLTFLLGSHPQIATIGELGIAERTKRQTTPEEYLCSCHLSVRKCPFWQRVRREMAERGHEFDVWDSELELRARGGGLSDVILRAVQRGPALEMARSIGVQVVPGARRELARVLSRIEALAEIVTGIKGSRIFLDSSKRPERAVFMRRIPSFDLRVIHLVRDGRAVSWSNMKNLGLGPEAAADSWIADNRASEQARRYFPADRWLTLRHEDVCADPPGALSRIYSFTGLPPADGLPELRGGEHHIIGNRMRLASTSDIRLDERWKTALAPTQMATIERRVAPLNRRYGYGAL